MQQVLMADREDGVTALRLPRSTILEEKASLSDLFCKEARRLARTAEVVQSLKDAAKELFPCKNTRESVI